tara:strand:+ start:11854 stop:12519 length:666 start_codon:yes stop_codon:yes gene_type:complete
MWITESAKKGKALKDMFNVNGVDVYIKDRLPDNVDPDFVFKYINARVPFHLTTGIDIIYIGQFPEMKERDLDAYYEDGAIYVTNDQSEEMDMIDDIVHELAHAVEVNNEELIYGSGALQNEFLAKRKNLSIRLKDIYDVPRDFNINMEYDEDIDMFLYQTVGYDMLNQLVVNIFVSGYAATSLSEYFARGFEEYFISGKDNLRKLSPVLHGIIDELVHLED